MNNRDADLTVRMLRVIFAFFVHIDLQQNFHNCAQISIWLMI